MLRCLLVVVLFLADSVLCGVVCCFGCLMDLLDILVVVEFVVPLITVGGGCWL